MKKPEYIIIHHTAVSYSKNPDQWKATDTYHKSKGWGGGGYNYEVAASGSIHQFREDGSQTAAQYQKNMNDGRAISICMDGDFDIELPTFAQQKAMKEFLLQKMQQYSIPKENILKHRDLAIKTCPGSKLPDDIFSYFFPMDKTNQILEWAKDAVMWAVKEGFVTNSGQLSEEIQKTLVILKRYHEKYVAPNLPKT